MLDAGWQPDDDEQIALACASHSGEPMHLDVVRRILASAGLDESALQNTADLPLNEAAAHALLRAGGDKRRAAPELLGQARRDARHLRRRTAGRSTPTAIRSIRCSSASATTVERAGRRAVARRGGRRMRCAVVRDLAASVWRVPSRRMRRERAAGRRRDAGASGARRRHRPRRDRAHARRAGLVAKDGAEGVYAAALPDGRAVAVKIDDGAGRARRPVLAWALRAARRRRRARPQRCATSPCSATASLSASSAM